MYVSTCSRSRYRSAKGQEWNSQGLQMSHQSAAFDAIRMKRDIDCAVVREAHPVVDVGLSKSADWQRSRELVPEELSQRPVIVQ